MTTTPKDQSAWRSARVEGAVLLVHLGMWKAWDVVATQPARQHVFYGLAPTLALVAIYAEVDNVVRDRAAGRSRSLVTVVMLTAVLSSVGGWRDGKAHAARRQAAQPARVATPEAIGSQDARHVVVERWAAPAALAAEATETVRDSEGEEETVTCGAVPLMAPRRVAAVEAGRERAVAVALVSPDSEAELRADELAPIPRDNTRPLYLRIEREADLRDACQRALASLRRRKLLAPGVAVTRSVLAPRTGPLPSPAGPTVRASLALLVVIATLATRATR